MKAPARGKTRMISNQARLVPTGSRRRFTRTLSPRRMIRSAKKTPWAIQWMFSIVALPRVPFVFVDSDQLLSPRGLSPKPEEGGLPCEAGKCPGGDHPDSRREHQNRRPHAPPRGAGQPV